MAYYTALQLPRNATAEEIKRAYRKLALAAHPERATSTDSADVEDNFNLIAEAYDASATRTARYTTSSARKD